MICKSGPKRNGAVVDEELHWLVVKCLTFNFYLHVFGKIKQILANILFSWQNKPPTSTMCFNTGQGWPPLFVADSGAESLPEVRDLSGSMGSVVVRHGKKLNEASILGMINLEAFTQSKRCLIHVFCYSLMATRSLFHNWMCRMVWIKVQRRTVLSFPLHMFWWD